MSSIRITTEIEVKTNNGLETIADIVGVIDSAAFAPNTVSKIELTWFNSQESYENKGLPIKGLPKIILSQDEFSKHIAYLTQRNLEEKGLGIINNAVLKTPWSETYVENELRVFMYGEDCMKMLLAYPNFLTYMIEHEIHYIIDSIGVWFYLETLETTHEAIMESYGAMKQTINDYNLLLGIDG